MPLIVDPDDLNQGTEIVIDASAKTIQLVTTGNLSDDGVTGQAVYSFLKEEWRSDVALIPYLFPMVSITPEQFEFFNGWLPADDVTRNLLRSCGWREIGSGGTLLREYVGIVSLGNIDAADTAYYAFASDTSKTDFDFPGVVNQGIQTFGNASNGSFNKRNEELSVFIRTQGKLYGKATSSSIGLSALNYIANRFPLAEADDLKITASDSDIANNAPYTGMSIRLFPSPQTRSIGGVDYDFGVVIDGNFGTAEQIYEFVEYSLRQNVDIDSDGGPDIIGSLLDPLVLFVGNNLQTLFINNPDGGGGGAYIDNFNVNDTNRISFTDNNGNGQTFPFVAAGALNFNPNLVADAEAIYRMFFTSGFETPGAILVNDNSGSPISGDVGGNASIGIDFDYDGNTQGGRTAGTDAAVTVVAIGTDDAQYVVAEAVITRASGQNITLVAPLERNYSNP
jgi:hypothetical protein